jgi:ABC-2 type transport system ATP-binding protein
MDELVIDVMALSKVFRVSRRREGASFPARLKREITDVHAVENVTFSVRTGEMVGFIGPNGAGKSTTIKMLTGILVPTAGSVRVAGLEPSRKRTELARKIGVVFGQRTQLWWDLPLRDSFDLLRHIYRVPAVRHAANVSRCIELLQMGPFLSTPVRQLSLGQRMRGEVTAALLHDPEILFLDEPTIGLDVVAKARLREFLIHINSEQRMTVLLTTHDMGDMERLCSRLMIVDRGGLIYDGDIEGVRQQFGADRRVIVDLEAESPAISISHVTVERIEGPRQWLRFRRDEISAADVIAAVARSAAIVDLTVEEPLIEDVVRRLYESRQGAPTQPQGP